MQRLRLLALGLAAAGTIQTQATTTVVALTDDAAPDGTGIFWAFYRPVINDIGAVAFAGDLDDTSGGHNDESGIFRWNGSTLTQIARSGQSAPDGNGVIQLTGLYPSVSMNNRGDVRFSSTVVSTADTPNDTQVFYRGNGGALVQVARTWQYFTPGDSKLVVALEGNGLAINDLGQIGFWATFRADPAAVLNRGVFLSDGTDLVEIAREGAAAPDGPGIYKLFDEFAFNNNGGAVFKVEFERNTAETMDHIFLASSSSPPARIVSEGMVAPNSNGYLRDFFWLTINTNSQVAFKALVLDTAASTFSTPDILDWPSFAAHFKAPATAISTYLRSRLNQSSTQLLEAWEYSEPVPFALKQALVNDLNVILLGPSIWDRTRFDKVTLRPSTILLRAQEPEGGTLIRLNRFLLEDAFPTEILRIRPPFWKSGLASVSVDSEGIFLWDKGVLKEVVRTGQTSPDGNGQFDGVVNILMPVLNNSGQVVFVAPLNDTIGGSLDDAGIFRFDGTSLTQIVRNGQPAPDGNGRFSMDTPSFDYFNPALNDLGQIAFAARLAGTAGGSSDDEGIFFWDESLGLIQVAREGDAFMGSRFSTFGSTFAAIDREPSLTGINNRGEIAFKFRLADRSQGIAVWSVSSHTRTIQLGWSFNSESSALLISWPSSVTHGVLEENSDLSNSTGWMPVGIAPEIVGSEFQVVMSLETGQRFFRLQTSQP